MTVTAVRLEFWNVFWAGLAEGAGPVEDRAAEALGGMAEADCRDVCLSFFECKRKYEWKCVSKRISECKYECKYFRKVYLKILKRILFKCNKPGHSFRNCRNASEKEKKEIEDKLPDLLNKFREESLNSQRGSREGSPRSRQ